jgi:hypothetical protein
MNTKNNKPQHKKTSPKLQKVAEDQQPGDRHEEQKFIRFWYCKSLEKH